MNYLKVILFILAAAAGAIILYVFLKGNLLNKQNALASLLPQINSEGLVTVKVTPKDLTQSAASWDFEIILDTHSGNLDQDLTKTSVLTDDSENQFNAISWEGDPLQGHHRQGILKFPPITPKPQSIELKINQIGDIDERIFKWELK